MVETNIHKNVFKKILEYLKSYFLKLFPNKHLFLKKPSAFAELSTLQPALLPA